MTLPSWVLLAQMFPRMLRMRTTRTGRSLAGSARSFLGCFVVCFAIGLSPSRFQASRDLSSLLRWKLLLVVSLRLFLCLRGLFSLVPLHRHECVTNSLAQAEKGSALL